jgi:alanine dehydrogenase
MAPHGKPLSLGLPRIRNEPGEVRDFLPPFVEFAAGTGVRVLVESGYGNGMGYRDEDYCSLSLSVSTVERARAYAADIVLALRPSVDTFDLLRPGATFMAMLHFPTRVQRARRLKELGVDAIALDLIVDDEGDRLVEDMRAVAWNGVDAAFKVLMSIQPNFHSIDRPHTRVTVLGAGMVGRHAVEAATKFGDRNRADHLACEGQPGVEVTTLGRNMTCSESYMRRQLGSTDLLVDAARRSDPSRPLIPNSWLQELPPHAVICDLAVDPYLPDDDPPVVRGIEGIPMGVIGNYEFSPDDPAWAALPPGVPTFNRRWVVSCCGWPGLQPVKSMTRYGSQLELLLRELIGRRGAKFLRPTGNLFERALYRGSLTAWIDRL